MVEHYTIRSDFADEAEACEKTNDTFTHEKLQYGTIKSSYIRILKEENVLGKEIGDYVSIQFENLFDHEERENIVKVICEQMHRMLKHMKLKPKKILVVGLGNRFITSDALGPGVANEILVTAHYYRYEDKQMLKGTRNVAVLQPGVMGQTGLESFAIVQSVAKEYEPDLIFAIDALATRNIQRINRVVQINNTGIQPGSGVGNHRCALNETTLGIPVIAVGVATVTSIGAILSESLELADIDKDAVLQNIHEKNHLQLVVTPKSMDDELKHLIYLVSESLNRVIHPDYQKL